VVAVGQLLAFLTAAGETAPASVKETAVAVASTSPHAAVAPAEWKATPAANEGRLRSTPRARRVAREIGVDCRRVPGTGRNGRVRERDVRAAASSSVPISGRRKAIAEKLAAGWRQAVPVTLTSRADATNLVAHREKLKRTETVVPTYIDLIAGLVAPLLVEHPLLAGRWEEERIALPQKDGIHIGVAVDTPEGLLVPVLRDVLHTPPAELWVRSKELVDRARAGTLATAEMQGSVFTITNLGAFGIDAFTPVLNFPEAAILGLGAIRRKPVFDPHGHVVARDLMTLSLTFDHRVLDGAPAARFLQAVCKTIEEC
jgi:pyruvate dehydrogenase E2 component (dihydrolipoamide acetyltransferase)